MGKIGARGGMSRTTTYLVKFDRSGGDLEDLNLFCDEAQLPNVQAATAQMAGRFLGEGPYQYPHTRLYTDVSLGFLCDANLTQLKFFQEWYDQIFMDKSTYLDNADVENIMAQGTRTRERTTRLAYPESYTCTTRITKVELGTKTAKNYVGWGDRPSITYMLEGSYPYAIDAVPLSYGSSQITRVTVNFHYVRHSVIYADVKKNKNIDTTLGMNDIPSSIAAGLG
tara:strand:- start:31 stop:705 length:675 start_codon:yes stop_codon:yes gene_type:complete